jgi:glycosyltransferase XagB
MVVQFQQSISGTPVARPNPVPVRRVLADRPGVTLLRDGMVQPDNLIRALALRQRQPGSKLHDILVARNLISPKVLTGWQAREWRLPTVDPLAEPGDPRLIDRLGAMECLRLGVLPWRNAGGATVVVVTDPDCFLQNQPQLTQIFGQVIPAIASFDVIEAAILAQRGPQLDHAAQQRTPDSASCRNWRSNAMPFWVASAMIALITACLFAPLALATALTLSAVVTLIFATTLKTASLIAALRITRTNGIAPHVARLPIVSVMVPLYREAQIAARLVERLGRIDYPRDLLDVLLVVEEDDQITRTALAKATLPSVMRVVVVPQGQLKTKPRALNHALGRCRGSIIGIYDAEDAPAPDQISRVVQRFHERDAKVVCLQGVLDFYNPHSNWLSRCFTMEYAAWFRLLLPGMARLGLAVPLGGTTLFFRRSALEEVGAWDAHNVTEDADLGMRLARHGYRTELIDSVTMEEANCRALPWVRQRSRWLKGYMMTYAVQMRDPKLLLRQLGWWKFAGLQVFFLTTLSQFLLTPVLLSFWVIPFGLPHPVMTQLSPLLATLMFAAFLWSEAVLLVSTLVAMRRTKHRMNPLWALALHVYFPLGALAAYKALWELVTQPFYWDKTTHGICDAA